MFSKEEVQQLVDAFVEGLTKSQFFVPGELAEINGYTGGWVPKCAACLQDYLLVKGQIELGVMNADGTELVVPEIKDAVTFLPSWQTQAIQGQVAMALCSLPSCFDHMMPKEESAQEKASKSGLALPGQGGFPN